MKQSPVTPLKACKNRVELQGFRNCHVRDGAAMVKFLYWLENTVPKGSVTEISAAQELLRHRQQQELFQGESFAPISAYGAHGAVVHYSATEQSDAELKTEGIYLIDSGGQYLDGTTDITRTVAMGTPTDEQKDRFTRVLKGHINLAMARFPEGTTGIQLDTIARKPLWDIAENYGHGTGHGIGVFLNVHEGPQAISYYRGIGVALKPGMICSNEPGFYKEGEYGIRIENLVEIQIDETVKNKTFLKCATATLCPIDKRLVETSLLTKAEIDYFNAYHKRVYENLHVLLDEDEKKWLYDTTRPV
jgi:Xaa-Pro aminopeptidase